MKNKNKNNTFKLIIAASILALLIAIVFIFANKVRDNPKTRTGLAAIQGDCNNDGRIDIIDFQLLSNSFGKSVGQTGYDTRCDFNGSGNIDILDFQILSNNFGNTTPTATITQRPATGTPRPTATPTLTGLVTPTTAPTPPPGNGVWISQSEIMSYPTTGTAWTAMLNDAAGSWGTPDISNQDSTHDQKVLAGSLVCARVGQHCDKTVTALLNAIGTEGNTRWLAVGRNMLGYTIAADVLRNSGRLTGTDLSRVSTWLGSFLTRQLPSNNSGEPEILTPFESGSNASAQEGAVYAAIAHYTNNQTKLNYVWNRYRLYSCDKINNPETEINITNGFEGGWSHASTLSEACAVNPSGSTKNGHNIDGAVINDIVRGGSFTWPPAATQYVWTGFRGYIDAAVILKRAGFPALTVKDSAPLRAIQYICYLQNNTPGGWWTLSDSDNASHLAKSVYGWNAPSGCATKYPTGQDMILGFTDWSHPL